MNLHQIAFLNAEASHGILYYLHRNVELAKCDADRRELHEQFLYEGDFFRAPRYTRWTRLN